MVLKSIDGGMLKEMYLSGCALLNQNREAVDALNVFPVPDGDTGTNMSQTMNAAVKELNSRPFSSVSDVASAAARGALRGARGNSGVILSQILRGIASALEGHDDMDAALLVKALRAGAQTAYKAVMKPKEGTILTVARVIAEEVESRFTGKEDIIEIFTIAVKSGDAILKRTPDMLPVLKQAGVVDSGGKGLMVIYSGFLSALTGSPVESLAEAPSAPLPGDFVDDHDSLEEITFGYCTEFIVSHPRPDIKNADVTRLRKRLERIGDCVLVISDLSVVKVHVHTNDPGKALQMALELGELDSIKIDNMLEEHRERVAKQAAAQAAVKNEEKEYGIIAVALGDGFSEIFRGLNIDKIVDGGQTMNPSIDERQERVRAAEQHQHHPRRAAGRRADGQKRHGAAHQVGAHGHFGRDRLLARRDAGGESFRNERRGGARAHRLHHLRRARHGVRRPRNSRQRHHGHGGQPHPRARLRRARRGA